MPVIAGQMRWAPALNRTNGVIAAVTAIAAALSMALVVDPQFSRSVGERVSRGVHGFETVAAMLAERSPGQRPSGALANLKQKKSAVEASEAPIGRHVIPPVAGLMGAPATPLIIPPVMAAPPLYNVVAGTPPVSIIPAAAGGGGGPPILSEIPPAGGGIGGVVAPPPIITQSVPPPPAATGAVPEPASWAMMLVGFATIGGALRRKKRNRAQHTIG